MKQKMNCFLLIYLFHCTYLNLAVRKFVNAVLDYRLDVIYTLYILIKFELYNSLANAHWSSQLWFYVIFLKFLIQQFLFNSF